MQCLTMLPTHLSCQFLYHSQFGKSTHIKPYSIAQNTSKLLHETDAANEFIAALIMISSSQCGLDVLCKLMCTNWYSVTFGHVHPYHTYIRYVQWL